MGSNKIRYKNRIAAMGILLGLAAVVLIVRLSFLMIFKADHYYNMAENLHERERTIKAARGLILDSNGKILAGNKTVCTVSVIYNQIEDTENIIKVLCKELELDEESVRRKVGKKSVREIICTNISKEKGEKIREYKLSGVKVDEDYRRYYPNGYTASKILGFTGGDNQGIIGLEAKYDKYLRGEDGYILTKTTAAGIELENMGEERKEPVTGASLYTSIDLNIQKYAQQAAEKVLNQKKAKQVSIIVMNVENGEILAMVNVPEFDLNNPFDLGISDDAVLSPKERMNMWNKMWRNSCINDTYEPGSTFKIITAAAGLEEGVVKLDDLFSCPGFRVVEDRKIRCHKTQGHGSETFLQGAMNSCNPVFIDVGQRLGVDNYYKYFKQFGLLEKTGIDLPGEALTIMHKKKDIGPVELATISFGQSFQITPIKLIATAASIINGGYLVIPHIGVKVESDDKNNIHIFNYNSKKRILSEKTSTIMRYILEKVVSDGSGRRAKLDDFKIGGKTATSEKLPRSLKKYISSFIGFAPADAPKVIALITIDEPTGIYYGGTIAAPVIADIFKNILPYMGISSN